ncbi:leucyl/phenylalanyl-tRNA--protein transferase [Poseidonibacter ostreae]|uniref:Leucyl/phenylalanyl-tRNA--protein transferase n=1 Tax=Poseidonibacter ostreae TaxID=2654171 RepID=A0A6L4WV70_9BACT|nr:leucyl/phenylalanyl-tRNA--protein transferase [Poseidonibacter ostreae]KAB7890343.1 leucyl/phenylalanyl-tRNA--protein transferase [Poseidonibacter ostreae]
MNIYPLDKNSYIFPNPIYADDKGLLAYGGDLNPSRIMTAYLNGIFPWYNESDPILWWSPNPRCILDFEDFKISKSLRKVIDKNIFEIKFDTNFTQVMKECKNINRENQKGTWIQDELIEAYTKLHEMGFAHSFEAYFNGELVGGGYGINIGNIFCGESMFAKKTDASKVALYFLVQRLKEKGFSFIDCQIPTPHLLSLGAKTIDRNEFILNVKKSSENLKEF